MNSVTINLLPGPLLRTYCAPGLPTANELAELPLLGPRFRAILDARERFLNDAFLDGATAAELEQALVEFYLACVRPALHLETVRRRAGRVRHGLAHLLRNRDALPLRLERCLAPTGPYHVPGLGPTFWSALGQALEPADVPGWTNATVQGLERLGLRSWPADAAAAPAYSALSRLYAELLQQHEGISALHLDHFFSLAAGMKGRDLGSGLEPLEASLLGADLPGLLRQQRSRLPLRRLLRERGQTLQEARELLQQGLAVRQVTLIGQALERVDPLATARAGLDWPTLAPALLPWAEYLWETVEPYEALGQFWREEPIPRAGVWLPTLLLHLRSPKDFFIWTDITRAGYVTLAGLESIANDSALAYRLFNEGCAALSQQQRLHPLEVSSLLTTLVDQREQSSSVEPAFGGFCGDTFLFLAELARNNRRVWMTQQRDRYQFVLRQPLVELCQALVRRYVEPVLGQQWGWELETAARPGKALTSICKNAYGRSAPYQEEMWLTFCRRGCRRDDAQFFVRVAAAGVSFGLRLNREARAAGKQFRVNVQEHAELLHSALATSGALGRCLFAQADDLSAGHTITSAGDLRAWASGKNLVAGKFLAADSPLLRNEELVGEVLLTFDQLLPAYACAVSADPLPLLRQRSGHRKDAAIASAEDFLRATHLPAEWLERARSLLELKRQLILQGVPGTGKTHVARLLAALLTNNHPEAVRLVQFHPAYSYEEFVEGIRARTVESEGKHQVTYPVEEGVLCSFAAQAALEPAQPHVLVIDEINRSNLPRVFGELLYLLEYREHSVVLPCSRRHFRLPANLYLLGTMNAADRSVALIDQALRRRFSFLDMPPDADVLASWLRQQPPRADTLLPDVVGLFDRLNAQLRKDLGPQQQVGHSYFMVPELDESKLRVVWQHQIRPLLEEYFARGDLPASYELERLLRGRRTEPASTAPGR